MQVEEFKGVVDQEYFGWVAQYLVMKRVSIEPNFHTLYMNFLDALNEKQLFVVVLKETHRNIKVLGLHTPTQARMYACKHAHTHNTRVRAKLWSHILCYCTYCKFNSDPMYR